MNDLSPYTDDELRRIRRLILAAGLDIVDWANKLRRSADFLRSLSPGQAAIVAQQAAAIAAAPNDIGPDGSLEGELLELEAVPEGERRAYISRQIIAIRRLHFPGLPDE